MHAQLRPALFDPLDCSRPPTPPQAPLSMELSRQESCSGLPLPSPGDLSRPGIELMSPALAGGFFITEPPLGLNCGTQDLRSLLWVENSQLQDAGSSSLTRDGTRAPCIGSSES